MKTTIYQLNFLVGDIQANTDKILSLLNQNKNHQSLHLFPELAVTGYPPRDLLYIESFEKEAIKASELIQDYAAKERIDVLFGGIGRASGGGIRNRLYGVKNGEKYFYDKQMIPHFDIFDEPRYFEEGPKEIPSQELISNCADIWACEGFDIKCKPYPSIFWNQLKNRSEEYLINLSASPFLFNKFELKIKLWSQACRDSGKGLVYVNCVGSADDLLMEGRSLVFSPTGELLFEGESFKEAIYQIDTSTLKPIEPKKIIDEELAFDGLTLAIKTYFQNAGNPKAILGVSGGMDSAVVHALLVHALGKENVLTYSLPSEYSSKGSLEDAKKMVETLGNSHQVIPINFAYKSFESLLAQKGFQISDQVHQNLQARTGGMILMSISNSIGGLVVCTSNKSEIAMGYSTLYGDTVGAIAPLGDIYKTHVYDFAGYVNKRMGNVIPSEIFTKPPSAELKPGQKDEDSLGPYSILDEELKSQIDREAYLSYKVQQNEYKRRQMPLIFKLSKRTFGVGRRYPIQHFYKGEANGKD